MVPRTGPATTTAADDGQHGPALVKAVPATDYCPEYGADQQGDDRDDDLHLRAGIVVSPNRPSGSRSLGSPGAPQALHATARRQWEATHPLVARRTPVSCELHRAVCAERTTLLPY